jgi:HK97 family phage major capsid protein
MTTPQIIDTKELAQEAAQLVRSELEDEILKQVKAAMVEFEEKAVKTGLATPDGGTADGEIQNFGDFLLAIKRKDEKRLQQVYKSTKALNEQDGTDGGYLVPAQFNATLLQFATEVNPIDALTGPRAPMTLPMSSRTLTIPALDQTANPATGASALTAGVVGGWTEEAGSLPETQPKFRPLTLNAHKYAGYTKASNELEADSATALAQLLSRLFGQAVGYARLHSFLRGDGVGKPLGIYGHAAAYPVTRGTGAAVYETEDLLAMYARLMPGSHSRAVWFANPLAVEHLGTLQFGTNQALVFPMTDGAPARMLGCPFYPVEFMSAPGNAFDLALIDWSYYLIGNRAQTSIAASEHAAFLTDEMTWKFVHRVDGQPWPNGTRKLSDGANSAVAPFIYLN